MRSRRPHLIYGTRELELGLEPNILRKLEDNEFAHYHPARGKLFDSKDRAIIGGYVDELFQINQNLMNQMVGEETSIKFQKQAGSKLPSDVEFFLAEGPGLPKGITLDQSTGSLVGIPKEETVKRRYKILAKTGPNGETVASCEVCFGVMPKLVLDEKEDEEEKKKETDGSDSWGYDPEDYANLSVSGEIKDLFHYITVNFHGLPPLFTNSLERFITCHYRDYALQAMSCICAHTSLLPCTRLILFLSRLTTQQYSAEIQAQHPGDCHHPQAFLPRLHPCRSGS
jgi:hypothetical protein